VGQASCREETARCLQQQQQQLEVAGSLLAACWLQQQLLQLAGRRLAGCSSSCYSWQAGGWLRAAGAGRREVEEQQQRQQRLAASEQQQRLACSCRLSSGMWRVEVTATMHAA
jgi:hypothetical protein